MTANNFERVNLSPLLLGNTAARIKVKSPERRIKKRLFYFEYTSWNILQHYTMGGKL